MTAQEQALAEIIAAGVRNLGVPNVVSRDDSTERTLPCVSVVVSRGENDPMGSNCFAWKAELTARTKSEKDMAEVGGKLAELTRLAIKDIASTDNQFTVFGTRFDGMESSSGPNSRATAISFTLWCADTRS